MRKQTIRKEITEDQIKQLLACIPRAEEVDRLKAEVDRQRAEIERLTRERDEARDEVKRLRGTIRKVASAADGCISRDKIVRMCFEALEAKR